MEQIPLLLVEGITKMCGRLSVFSLLFAALLTLAYASTPGPLAGQASGGSIVGQVRIAPGSQLTSRVMVTLLARGAVVNTIYTDDEGRFGFHGLPGNLYHVVINEKNYQPVEET